MATNIAVCCRFRPAASNELNTAAKRCVKVDATKGSVALLADQVAAVRRRGGREGRWVGVQL